MQSQNNVSKQMTEGFNPMNTWLYGCRGLLKPAPDIVWCLSITRDFSNKHYLVFPEGGLLGMKPPLPCINGIEAIETLNLDFNSGNRFV